MVKVQKGVRHCPVAGFQTSTLTASPDPHLAGGIRAELPIVIGNANIHESTSQSRRSQFPSQRKARHNLGLQRKRSAGFEAFESGSRQSVQAGVYQSWPGRPLLHEAGDSVMYQPYASVAGAIRDSDRRNPHYLSGRAVEWAKHGIQRGGQERVAVDHQRLLNIKTIQDLKNGTARAERARLDDAPDVEARENGFCRLDYLIGKMAERQHETVHALRAKRIQLYLEKTAVADRCEAFGYIR
jgi:hypothetical protein